MKKLIEILQDLCPSVQSFRVLRECPVRDQQPSPYKMVIWADRSSPFEHARRYNVPTSPKVAGTVHGGGDRGCRTRYIVCRACKQLSANGNEVLGTISVIHCSYLPPFHVLLFKNGRDVWYLERRVCKDSGALLKKVSTTRYNSWYLFHRRTSSVVFCNQ